MNVCLSVIVPVYNIAPYVRRCIESLLCQSFSDFELLIIDDGSTDGSAAICDEYAGKEKCIRVIHQINAGVTAARRRGVEEAKGDWICFVDGDDILPQNAFCDLYGHTSDVDIVIGRIHLVDINGRILQRNCQEERCLDFVNYLKALLEHKVPLSPVGRIFRKSLFDPSILDLPPTIRRGEDYIMNVRLAIKSEKIRIIDRHVYDYIQYSDSCLHRFRNTWEYEKLFNSFLLRSITDHHLEEECKESIVHAHIHLLMGVLDDPNLNKKDAFYLQIEKEAFEIQITLKEKLLLNFVAFPFYIRKFIYKTLKNVYHFGRQLISLITV